MQNLEQKTKWLKIMGVEYYLGDKPRKLMDCLIDPKGFSCKDVGVITGSLRNEDNTDLATSSLQESIKECGDPNAITSESRALANKASSIEELRRYIENFEGCELKKFANNTVFAQGNPKAHVMFIGEAPGATEDLKGVPFCGESGMLLDNMLKSINISRESNAYITNTVFWRPPANRAPTQEEIDICRPFVEKHIALINPKIIILVGSTAVTSLFGKHAGITKIRGEYLTYTNKYLTSPVAVTSIFHPAYLLRQPMQKKTSWFDLLKLQQFLKENA